MAEQKKLGVVIKSAKSRQQKDEKKLYTIISGCVAVVFLLSIFVPLLSSGEDKSPSQRYKEAVFDLADLAVDDEAEKVLLDMKKYSDIPEKQISGSIFTKKEKEVRQKKDKLEGIPAAPDEEYKQARKTRNTRKSNRKTSRTPAYRQSNSSATKKTTTGNLSRSGMVSISGGSSGVSSSVWTSQDKSGQKNSAAKGSTGSLGTQQLVASTGAKGRSSGLLRAIEESKKGADSKNADVAAQAATDAFTNNNIEAEEDDLKDGMDALADQFNADEFQKALNNNDLTDLKNEAEKEKEKNENKDADPCKSRNKAIRMECMREQFLEKLMEKLVDAAVDVAQAYAEKGLDKKEYTKDGLQDLTKKYENLSEADKNGKDGKKLKREINQYGRHLHGRKDWKDKKKEIFGE